MTYFDRTHLHLSTPHGPAPIVVEIQRASGIPNNTEERPLPDSILFKSHRQSLNLSAATNPFVARAIDGNLERSRRRGKFSGGD